MLTPKLQMLQRTIKRLLRRTAGPALDKLMDRTHAADLGYLLPHFSESEQVQLLEHCPNDDKRAQVVSAADSDVAAELLTQLPRERAVELLQRLPPDDTKAILEYVDEDEAQELLRAMRGLGRTDVEDLAHYDYDTAGGIMSPRFFALHRDTSAREAIEQLQRVSEELEMAFYVYVINEVGQLLGVVSLRQLVTTKPETTLFSLMTSDIVSVRPNEDQEEVAKLASRYGLLAVPVVDDGNKLLGIVTVDDVIDVLREEATEDILRMAGAGDELAEQQTVLRATAQRLPWLIIAGAGGVASAALLAIHAEVLVAFLPVVFFVPLLLALSGMTGMQGAAVVAQRIAQGRLDGKLLVEVARQSTTGLLLGLMCGALCAATCWMLWAEGAQLARPLLASAFVGAGVTVAMTCAAALGGLLPFLLARLRVDPGLAAGPLGAIVVDVIAVLVYLSLCSQAL